MRYFEQCKTCRHEHGNGWTEVCRHCCFCDKYEEKPKEDDFETRLSRMKNTLGTWASIYGISLAVDIRNEQGRLIGPRKRNFIFVDKKTGNKMDFVVDFNLHESEEEVQIIDRIKDTIRREMCTKAKGYAFNDPETYGRGGFVYLTTRNPYLDGLKNDWMARYQQDPTWHKHEESLYPIRPLANKTCKNCGHRKEDVNNPKSHCYRCDRSRYNDNPSEWIPKVIWERPDDLDDRYRSIVNKRIADKVADEQFKMFMRGILGINKEVNMNTVYKRLAIKDVIFNGPATIVIWNDNTKTVVKAQDGEKIDYEKGLAMAISKKALGNQGNYYDNFSKWLKNAPVVKKTTRKTVKKVEITDEEIQAQSDAMFAEFDKKVKKTTRRTVKKDK